MARSRSCSCAIVLSEFYDCPFPLCLPFFTFAALFCLFRIFVFSLVFCLFFARFAAIMLLCNTQYCSRNAVARYLGYLRFLLSLLHWIYFSVSLEHAPTCVNCVFDKRNDHHCNNLAHVIFERRNRECMTFRFLVYDAAQEWRALTYLSGHGEAALSTHACTHIGCTIAQPISLFPIFEQLDASAIVCPFQYHLSYHQARSKTALDRGLRTENLFFAVLDTSSNSDSNADVQSCLL